MLDILIIEPNPQLVTPYSLLTSIYRQPLSLTRVDNLTTARTTSRQLKPGLIMCSGSFSALDTLDFLEFLHGEMLGTVIPVVWVVDLSQPLSQVLGTAWGGKNAVLCSEAGPQEVRATLYRLFSAEFVDGPEPPLVAETVPDVIEPAPDHNETFVQPV